MLNMTQPRVSSTTQITSADNHVQQHQALSFLNRSADLLSQGNLLYGEWTFHPRVVEQIWKRYSRAAVDLFVLRENTQCPLYFSLSDVSTPLGMDALAHLWPRVLPPSLIPPSLIPPALVRVREHGLSLIIVTPRWPLKHWVAEIIQLLAGKPRLLPRCRDLSQA